MEVFGRRIIDVGDHAVRVFGLGEAVQSREKPLNLAPAMPAHERGRDFVADGVAQHSGMSRAGVDSVADERFHGADTLLVIEERGVAFDGQSDHDAQAVLLRQVQQPARRWRVGAHGIQAVGCHLGEVALDGECVGKFVPIGRGPKRAVGDPADEKFLVAEPDKFPRRPDPPPCHHHGRLCPCVAQCPSYSVLPLLAPSRTYIRDVSLSLRQGHKPATPPVVPTPVVICVESARACNRSLAPDVGKQHPLPTVIPKIPSSSRKPERPWPRKLPSLLADCFDVKIESNWPAFRRQASGDVNSRGLQTALLA